MPFPKNRLFISGFALALTVVSACIFHSAPRNDATTQSQKDTLAFIVLASGSWLSGLVAGSTLTINDKH